MPESLEVRLERLRADASQGEACAYMDRFQVIVAPPGSTFIPEQTTIAICSTCDRASANAAYIAALWNGHRSGLIGVLPTPAQAQRGDRETIARDRWIDWRGSVEGFDASVAVIEDAIRKADARDEYLGSTEFVRGILWLIGLDHVWKHIASLRSHVAAMQVPAVGAILRDEANRLHAKADTILALTAVPSDPGEHDQGASQKARVEHDQGEDLGEPLSPEDAAARLAAIAIPAESLPPAARLRVEIRRRFLGLQEAVETDQRIDVRDVDAVCNAVLGLVQRETDWVDQGASQAGADGKLARLRAEGWSVAVHNDYRLDGERHTFWLLTHADGRWIKGEGRTDEGALDAARAMLPAQPPSGEDAVGDALAAPGTIVWHSSEEDVGADVGRSVGLGGKRHLWIGEISRRLYEDHDLSSAGFGDDCGAWIVLYDESRPHGEQTTVVGKALDGYIGEDLCTAIAAAVRSERSDPQPPPPEGLSQAVVERRSSEYTFEIGEPVEKYTGDYSLTGTIVGCLTTLAGAQRYVVDHAPAAPGLLHIYSEANLRTRLDRASAPTATEQGGR